MTEIIDDRKKIKVDKINWEKNLNIQIIIPKMFGMVLRV